MSPLRHRSAVLGLGASPRTVPALRAGLRTQSRRHLGIHHHRRSAARRGDRRPHLLRLRPHPSSPRARDVHRPRRAARVDVAEPVGSRHRAALLVARFLARSVRSCAPRSVL